MSPKAQRNGILPSLIEDGLLVARNNKALLVFVVLIGIFGSPLTSAWQGYRLYLDRQIFYKDPDLVIVEGEAIKASNASYWINGRNKCFDEKYMALYTNTMSKEGYIFFRYSIPVKAACSYNIMFAGAPPGSKRMADKEEAVLPTHDMYFCPFRVFLDNKEIGDFNEQDNEKALLKEKGIGKASFYEYDWGFYSFYEYAKSFRVTKLGQFYLSQGDHELEFRIYDKPVDNSDYKFYVDAVFFVPLDWKPKSPTFSLPDDFISH